MKRVFDYPCNLLECWQNRSRRKRRREVKKEEGIPLSEEMGRLPKRNFKAGIFRFKK